VADGRVHVDANPDRGLTSSQARQLSAVLLEAADWNRSALIRA